MSRNRSMTVAAGSLAGLVLTPSGAQATPNHVSVEYDGTLTSSS